MSKYKYRLASNSEVKFRGAELAFPNSSIEKCGVNTGAQTSTIQPVGESQARQCCEERLKLAFDPLYFKGVRPRRVIVVESFIDKIQTNSGEVWVDKTMVAIQTSPNTAYISLVGPPLGVRIPSTFQPPLDTENLDYTVGSRIHEAHPDVPADDWYLFAGHPFSRAQVVRQTLDRCVKLRKTNSLETPETNKLFFHMSDCPMTVYPDFPIPGVNFADVFSLTSSPRFNKLMCDAAASFIRANFTTAELKTTCVVGLESRGLMLGYAMAIASRLAFVPARKPGKLAGPVEQESYEKEYGLDVLQMSRDHVAGFDTAIIVDDLIATGGSMEAACKLCERLGLRVGLVLALADVEELRSQWEQRLWPYNVRILANPTRGPPPY